MWTFYPCTIKETYYTKYKKSYFYYFKVHIGDQDKKWAPHIACNSCVNQLNEWLRGKRPSGMPFAVPMVWREQKDHTTDCYFCLTTIKGYSLKTRHKIIYPNVDSAISPVPNGSEITVANCQIESEMTSVLIDIGSTSSGDDTPEVYRILR